MVASIGDLTTTAPLGDLLRHWRSVRRMSQLDLASEAATTPRYVSFVETGRSVPSREMVVRLAVALGVPLRERNALLVAAGYAPLYRAEPLDAPQMGRVEAAVAVMLEQHDPFPAVVMDRAWNVLRANDGAQLLFGRLLAPGPPPDAPNVLRLMVGPGPVRERVENWEQVAPMLLDRARREAVSGVFDAATAELVAELRALPEVAAATDRTATRPVPTPVVDVRFRLGDLRIDFFSLVSTVGSPIDVTAQELRVETFFPSDDATAASWRAVAQRST